MSRQDLRSLEAIRRQKLKRRGHSDVLAFASSVGFAYEPWQERFLDSKSKRSVLLTCRQAGKSTSSAALILHTAYYSRDPSGVVLIFAPTLRQSVELLEKVRILADRLPVPPRFEDDNKQSLRFASGARVIALPAREETTRGYSAPLLVVIDEAQDCPEGVVEAVMPIMGYGRLVIQGTAKSRRGFFYRFCTNPPIQGWELQVVRGTDVPRFSPEFLAEQRHVMGPVKYGREFDCEFTDASEGNVYEHFDASRNLVDALPSEPGDEWTYGLGIDYGWTDPCGFVVMGTRAHDPCCYVVESFQKNKMVTADIAATIISYQKKYKQLYSIIMDSAAAGEIANLKIQHRIPVMPAQKQNKAGHIGLINGDLLAGKCKLVASTNQELISQIKNVVWNEDMTRPADGQPDHVLDSWQYIYTHMHHYLEHTLDLPKTPEEKARAEMDHYWEQVKEQEQIRDTEALYAPWDQ